jgi:hypothetical protein
MGSTVLETGVPEIGVLSELHQKRGQISPAILQTHTVGLADYCQVDMLGVRYQSVNFGAGKSPGSPNWWAQIDKRQS